ncbi:MAG: PSD1 and planctomycete cytochrome C domain-containing protein [Verrucomicrobiota bacterium]
MKPLIRTLGSTASTALATAFCAILLLPSSGKAQSSEKLQFNRDIRPILSDMCFQCHGPDNDKRKGDYRLDLREAALKGGKSETAGFVPGKANESEIIKRILSDDDDEHMPPKKSGKHMSAGQIATLKRWINEGADYQGHWAFSKVERPSPPATSSNPIDAFVTARLAKEKLKLSPEADKGTLLRRLSLDLTGLPPSPQELEAFLADNSPDAYEKVVDRLLLSPHYGERMAMQWLDFARYADSNGFQSDGSRKMSIWRDWVIKAYNQNKPFDQFTVEQLAGDLLPNASEDQIIATGFNRNHRLNGEGGRIEAEWFAETVIDRVETTGATWLALTVGCARCHDHKFDPLSQKEFYQLFAFFNSVDETGVLGGDQYTVNTKPFLTFPTPEQTAKLAVLEKNVEQAKAALKETEAKEASAEKKREKDILGEAPKWQILQPSELKSTNGATLTAEADGVIFASGNQPPKDIYSVTADTDLTQVTGIRLELLPDDRLPSKGPGRHANGNPVISEIRLTSSNKADGSQKEHVLKEATADFNQKGYDVARAIDGKADTGWAIHPETGKAHSATFTLSEPLNLSGGGVLTFTIEQNYGSGAILGKFRVSATSSPIPPQAPADVVAALKVPAAQRTDAQKKKIAEFHKQNGGTASAAAKAKVEEATKAKSALEKSIDSTMVMKERAEPRPANVLIRGQYDQLGAEVKRGLPAALPPLPPGAPENRLGLAQWIASTENPLTARVWVNRAWEKFFGLGLVKSSENFGSQSDWPSHPELLDWLAAEFMSPQQQTKVAGQPAQAWDMKALQKLIVMSATYRQTAKVTPALLEKDPDNRLLARGPRFRLTGEILRDSALSVSGLLSEKLGGPSVRPYMPKGVWDETSVYGDLLNYKASTGEDLYRRTLYTIWKRTAAPPTALLFDAPNREVCSVKRSRTNTPLQALALLNEVTYVEAARKLAENMIQSGGSTPKERLTWAFRRVTARTPLDSELEILVKGLEKQLARYSSNTDAAKELLGFGASKSPESIPPHELAAYTISANVLLNMDEFISR